MCQRSHLRWQRFVLAPVPCVTSQVRRSSVAPSPSTPRVETKVSPSQCKPSHLFLNRTVPAITRSSSMTSQDPFSDEPEIVSASKSFEEMRDYESDKDTEIFTMDPSPIQGGAQNLLEPYMVPQDPPRLSSSPSSSRFAQQMFDKQPESQPGESFL